MTKPAALKRPVRATRARRPRPMLRQQLRWWRQVYLAPHAGAKGRSR